MANQIIMAISGSTGSGDFPRRLGVSQEKVIGVNFNVGSGRRRFQHKGLKRPLHLPRKRKWRKGSGVWKTEWRGSIGQRGQSVSSKRLA